jgi:hypothetical protein
MSVSAAQGQVVWPPEEKVALVGRWSRSEVIGIAVTVLYVFGGAVVTAPWWFYSGAVLLLGWTFAPRRGVKVRSRVAARVAWVSRRDKVWSAPIRGSGGVPRCLRGVRFVLGDGRDGTVAGVVEAPGGAYTVVFEAWTTDPLAFLPPAAQSQRLGRWGAVLGSLCSDPGDEVSPTRVAWVDVHRASDPAAFTAHHARHGVAGSASVDYAAHVANAGSVASAHVVLIAVTITRPSRWRQVRGEGFTGSPAEMMRSAAIVCGQRFAASMTVNGFRCGPLLNPAQLARVVVAAGDPFELRDSVLSSRERFGAPERTGPDLLDASDRSRVAIDGALHRVFALRWPQIPVDVDWLWRPLGVDGPKIVTCVFEPIPVWRADARRDSLRNRARNNNRITAARRGAVRTVDQAKVDALIAAERDVAAGERELDGYALIVVTGRTPHDLAQRCTELRDLLHTPGRAGLRELVGLHDVGWAAALPLGIGVAAATETTP